MATKTPAKTAKTAKTAGTTTVVAEVVEVEMPDATKTERDGGLGPVVAETMRPACPACGTPQEPSSWERWYTDWQRTKVLRVRCACGWLGDLPFTPGR